MKKIILSDREIIPLDNDYMVIDSFICKNGEYYIADFTIGQKHTYPLTISVNIKGEYGVFEAQVIALQTLIEKLEKFRKDCWEARGDYKFNEDE